MAVNDFQNLPVGLGALPEGFGFFIKTGASKIFLNIPHFIMLGDPKPKIIIHTIMEIFVKKSNSFEYGTSYEHRGLANKASFDEPLPVERFSGVSLNNPTVLLDVVALPIDSPY